MVKTREDVDICEKAINRLEELGIPAKTIRDLREWLNKEVQRDPILQRIDKFHAHLDVCSRCRNHPFGLCSVGARLLEEAATGQVDEPATCAKTQTEQ